MGQDTMTLEELITRIAWCSFLGVRFIDIDWWSVDPSSVTIKTNDGDFIMSPEFEEGVRLSVRQYVGDKAEATGMAKAYQGQLLAFEVPSV